MFGLFTCVGIKWNAGDLKFFIICTRAMPDCSLENKKGKETRIILQNIEFSFYLENGEIANISNLFFQLLQSTCHDV
jgi:hypothetical protein